MKGFLYCNSQPIAELCGSDLASVKDLAKQSIRMYYEDTVGVYHTSSVRTNKWIVSKEKEDCYNVLAFVESLDGETEFEYDFMLWVIK